MNRVAQVVKPITRHWSGSYSPSDSHRYSSYTFIVPETSLGIRATIRYSGHGNYLGLGLYDSSRLRAHGRASEEDGRVELTAELWADEDAPGSLAGAVLPGTWQLEISTNRITRLCPFDLLVEIWPGRAASLKFPRLAPRAEKINSTPGWYKGDLHVHSTDSDGSKPAEELFRIAAQKGLDFLSLTDHNNIFNWWKLPGRAQGILPLPAMEITTFRGHANAFGITDWVDWRTGRNGRTINDVADEVHKLGGLFSVNHPCTPGLSNEHAAWRQPGFDWRRADAIEVWNAPVFSGGEEANRQCRALWDTLLNQGLRITGVGGSDAHYLGGSTQPLGLPANYVYLAELSREGLLGAIKKGRVFVSTGPEIYYCAVSDQRYSLPGGTLHRGQVSLVAHVWYRGRAPLVLTTIRNGELLAKVVISGVTFNYHLNTVAGTGDWMRMELSEEQDGEETLVAFTNPVYFV